jgi:hypothetical protein
MSFPSTNAALDGGVDVKVASRGGQGDASSLQRSLSISYGRCASDALPTLRQVTLADLVDEFSVPETSRGRLSFAEYHALDKSDPAQKAIRDREKDGGYFVPCRFSGDGRRCNNNIEVLCGIALDFDSGRTTEATIRQSLSGLTYIAYTSYSHRTELEKWRVFIPYEEGVDPALHRTAYQHLQQMFDGDIDARCETPSQLWYTPACPADAVSQFRAFHSLGELFDPRVLRDSVRPNTATPGPAVEPNGRSLPELHARLRAALWHVSADERKTWVNFGIAIKRELGEAGLMPWLEWSGRSSKFDLKQALKDWESFKDDTSGPKITVASIFYMAKECGWIDVGTDEVPAHIARLNTQYFVAPAGGKALIFKEGTDPLDGRETLQAMTSADFKTLLANDLIDGVNARGKHTRLSAAEDWIKHPKRRQYDGVRLAPNREIAGYYNLWRGFGVQSRLGSWPLMRNHILLVLCKGNVDVFEYVLNWLARAVQHPERQAEVAIVLCGGRGTGKGIFARAIGRLFGKHFRQISQARHLTGNFNAHLSDCILIFVDEAFWAGDKQGEAVLKHLITEPTLAIERKGLDVETMPNMLHVIMASNNNWVVPAGVDERRYLVLAVDDAVQQDTEYFRLLNEELENGGLEAMLHELLNRDIRTFNHRAVPVTTALIDQKLLSLEPHETWWFEKLQRGHLTGFAGGWELVNKQALQDDYIECVKQFGVSRRASVTSLGMQLRRLLPPGFPQSISATTAVQGVPLNAPHYRVPPLEVCRKFFEQLLDLRGYEWGGPPAVLEPL